MMIRLKMKKKVRATGGDTVTLNLAVPAGWQELTDRQLLGVFRLMAREYSSEEIKFISLLRWARLTVIGRPLKSKNFLVRHGRDIFSVSPMQFAEILTALDWLVQIPDSPVRLSEVAGRIPVDDRFIGVPFEKYLIIENLYQGFLQTRKDEFLIEIFNELYYRPSGVRRLLSFLRHPRFSFKRMTVRKQAVLLSVFYWVASLKKFFTAQFPDFFKPLGDDDSNLLGAPSLSVQLQDAMNAQIRALTKGDVTKEAEILKMDTWRALTELNAQAREYAEFKSKQKS